MATRIRLSRGGHDAQVRRGDAVGCEAGRHPRVSSFVAVVVVIWSRRSNVVCWRSKRAHALRREPSSSSSSPAPGPAWNMASAAVWLARYVPVSGRSTGAGGSPGSTHSPGSGGVSGSTMTSRTLDRRYQSPSSGWLREPWYRKYSCAPATARPASRKLPSGATVDPDKGDAVLGVVAGAAEHVDGDQAASGGIARDMDEVGRGVIVA